jgi:hypothetical protein
LYSILLILGLIQLNIMNKLIKIDVISFFQLKRVIAKREVARIIIAFAECSRKVKQPQSFSMLNETIEPYQYTLYSQLIPKQDIFLCLKISPPPPLL